ncbi:hypothetical protein C1I93_15905 [Micromonospora endophytica]|uniref:Uncharacterized protein n=1 Tax=Micromonospora endophytica TaxID=515350 RepID=A0A2W2DQ93_9ACTN|nr:hypothetical protein C1I93_15905 [Micromonospora endophytica]RIW46870.1 hypothetical protein D3H59_11475 [Micromonospora endophytica]
MPGGSNYGILPAKDSAVRRTRGDRDGRTADRPWRPGVRTAGRPKRPGGRTAGASRIPAAVRPAQGETAAAGPTAASKERSTCPSLPPRLTPRCWTAPRPAGTRTRRST